MNAGTITSSLWSLIAHRANVSATVPFETNTAYFVPIYFANFCSNNLINLPCPILSSLIAIRKFFFAFGVSSTEAKEIISFHAKSLINPQVIFQKG